MKPAGLLALAVVPVAVLALGTAWFVSSRSAESACTIEAERRGSSSISYAWSWSPLGTECSFDNGGSETRLFW